MEEEKIEKVELKVEEEEIEPQEKVEMDSSDSEDGQNDQQESEEETTTEIGHQGDTPQEGKGNEEERDKGDVEKETGLEKVEDILIVKEEESLAENIHNNVPEIEQQHRVLPEEEIGKEEQKVSQENVTGLERKEETMELPNQVHNIEPTVQQADQQGEPKDTNTTTLTQSKEDFPFWILRKKYYWDMLTKASSQ
uniref:Uncharacterized protein n=1 Tax=Arcella intermedia TaxID=1963864 RepID=A0A6B2LFL0_9EUKA